MSDPVLAVENMQKSFNGITANDGIDLTVQRGACHGIIGPNGSGKTTLFDIITGFQRPDAGRVLFDGTDVTGTTPDKLAQRGLVRSFQQTAPFEELTVRENLLASYTGSLRHGLRVDESTTTRMESLLGVLGLERVERERAADLSGGQQKLLELGRVLMGEPRCVLLDEPTAGVNPGLEQRLRRVLRQIQSEGRTIVLIEHDMSVVEALCDRVSVLDQGRLIADGSFDEVTDMDRVKDAYLGPDALEAVPKSVEGHSQTWSDAGHADSSGADTQVVQGNGCVDSSQAVDTASPGDDSTPAVTTGEEDAKRPSTNDLGNSRELVGANIVAGYGPHTVVDGVSIRSHNGVTCLFGPNGSGKSTLLKTLAGVKSVRSGEIHYGERSLTRMDAQTFIAAGISMVPQRNRIFDGLTVRENLLLGATVLPDDQIDEQFDHVTGILPSLIDWLDRRAGTLSGGEQTLVGIGRAMMSDAAIYLLDEPTSNLDPSRRERIFQVIQRLVDDGNRVILVEHNVTEAMAIADHVYVLASGECQFEGTPDELDSTDQVFEGYLGLE